MSSGIEINVLGDLQVLRDGEPIELPPSRKTRALLAYLAVIQRPQRRERLCEMFWEVPDDPRGALRWSLSKIRGLLNSDATGIFTADRNVVAIAPNVISTDFARIAALANTVVEDLPLEELQDVAALFRGPFLGDLSLPRCPEFEAWRIAHANETELLRLRVLRRLVTALSDRPDVALGYAQDLQRLAPDDADLPRLAAELAEAARRATVAGLGGVASVARPPASQATPEAEVRYCSTRDGVRVAYATTGHGPAIVRAAHWMSHLRYDAESPVWRHWIRELSAQNTLLRYDERGNGMSQWNVDDISFEAMVSDLEGIVDASGLERVVLLGVSQGCAISVAYAVRHPERVAGLVLYGGYAKGWRARGDAEEITLRQAMGTLMRRGWGKDDPVFRQLFTAMFIPGASREQVDWFNELQRKTVTPENAFRLAESFADIDVSELLARVSVPTLVMHAKGDKVAPLSAGQSFAAGIPGARFVELDSSNHILLEDEPAFAEFITQVRNFALRAMTTEPAEPIGFNARRPVSILSAELFVASLPADDPEAAAEILEPLTESLAETAAADGGLVIDARDGTVTVAFGAERAFEKHAVQACRAARAMRDLVSARTGPGGGVGLRIGIDAGPALIRGGTAQLRVTGPVIKTATRLAASLNRDAIALTARARESAGGYVAASRMPRSDTLGFAQSEAAYELLAENRALSRWYLRARQGLTPLVGRTGELARLAQAWQRAREGRGQAVSIVGSAGVGKSRIVHEFIGSQTFKAYMIVEAGAEEISENVSHDLTRRLLLSFFGLAGSEEKETVKRAVKGRLKELAMDQRLLVPLLFALGQPIADPTWHEMQGDDRAGQVREACVVLISKLSEASPIVILVEDYHWADALSRALLKGLAKAIAEFRVLLVVTARPGFEPPWDDLPYLEVMRLAPLSAGEGRALIAALLGDDPGLERLKAMICARAEGVPLFTEEIVGELVQSGRLTGVTGNLTVSQTIDEIDLPATIHSVLAARIDRMDPDERSLLQIASVIGAALPSGLLAEVSALGAALEPALVRLKAAEMLLDNTSEGEPEYAFKHALVKDAAYASLSAADRQMLHARILFALEGRHAAGRPDQAERLAFHAVRAGEWRPASRHLVAAADRAVESSAYPNAAEFLEQAIEALSHLPATRENIGLGIDIRTRLRVAYMVTGAFEKAIGRLNEAQSLAREVGDTRRLAYVLLHTSYVYSTWGRTAEALAAADEARSIGLLTGDERHAAEAELAAAQAHMIVGAAGPAIRLLSPHIFDFTTRWANDRLGFLVTRSVWFVGSLASARALTGEIEAAEADIAEALRLAEASGRPIDRYATAYFESLVRIVGGSRPDSLDRLRQMTEESRQRAPFPFFPWLTATLGHLELTMGRRAEATTTLETAFALAEQTNMPHFMTYASVMLAIAQARQGDAASREDLEGALCSARQSGDKWIEFEALMALAELETGTAAAGPYRAAMEVARSAGYVPFVARAEARLSRVQNRFLAAGEPPPTDHARHAPEAGKPRQVVH